MSRFVDNCHKYDDLCLDESGMNFIYDQMESQINDNLYSIKEVYCELQKNNLDYILRNITQNLVVVITRHQNTYDYNQFIGYPFPIHGKIYSGCLEKWINEIEGSENIYIKMFFIEKKRINKSDQRCSGAWNCTNWSERGCSTYVKGYKNCKYC